MDFPFRGAGNADGTNAFHTSKRSDKLVVEDLVKAHKALVRLRRKNQHRHVVHTELEKHRYGSSVRKRRVDKIQLVPDVVAGLVDVSAIFKFQDDDGDILL